MEQTILTPPPVPVAPKNSSVEFHKSKIILLLAYIQLGLFFIPLLANMARSYSNFVPFSILTTIPSFLIIFTKNKLIYKTASVLIVIEYVCGVLAIFALMYFLSTYFN